ncbi:MAG: DNA primase [Firmicutes bacterium]|nr:DNA primase [Bacillota bacterium]
MAQNSYSAAVEELKSRCNILDVVSPVVPLKRAGSNYKGCCPFHKEKTPSFVVSESRQTFHCFGCGAHGDIVGFTMRYYNLSFPEAVEKLAEQYGVQIESDFADRGKKREPYYDANVKAARLFFKAIAKGRNEGYGYAERRGLSPETIKTFGIGYADKEWNSLTAELRKEGVSADMMVELGLASQKGDRIYDKFRSRLMFPIINTQGKIIGFGGRIIGEGEPKYLNSPESLVFLKKNNLYGLNVTRSEIQKEGFAILVEGYMDVVGLYQGGVKNVTASLGTALTEQQARLLSRYTKKVVLCYDADAAGVKAALRGIDVLRAAGMDVSVLHVDDGKDPDEYIKKHGRDDFIKLINEKALPDVDYKIKLIARKYDVRDVAQSVKFFRACVGVLKTLPPVEAEIYIKKIAAEHGISEGALRSEVTGEGGAQQERPAAESIKAAAPAAEISESDLKLEKTLIRLIMLNSSYYERSKDIQEAFVSDEAVGLKNAFESQYSEGEQFDLDRLKDALDDEELEYLASAMKQIQLAGDDEKAFEDCVYRIEEKRRKARIEEIKDILSMAFGSAGSDEINALTLELSELSQNKKR